MTVTEEQIKIVQQRNLGLDNGQSIKIGSKWVACPLTTNLDVLTVTAYWFSAMRKLLAGSESYCYAWATVVSDNGEGRNWHITDYWGIATPPPDAPLIDLNTYLALPPDCEVDDSRPRAGDHSNRFCRGASFTTVEQAAVLRQKVEDGTAWNDPHAFVERGWLYTLVTAKQGYWDYKDSYQTYLETVIDRWDALIGYVRQCASFTMPGATIGTYYSDAEWANRFWTEIATLEAFLSQNSKILADMPGFTDWATTYASDVKAETKKVVQAGANVVADTAAWASNVAGESLGNAFSRFFDEIGIWGIAFVAILAKIYL